MALLLKKNFYSGLPPLPKHNTLQHRFPSLVLELPASNTDQLIGYLKSVSKLKRVCWCVKVRKTQTCAGERLDSMTGEICALEQAQI